MPPLVLASSSPYRAMLLGRLGVPFTQSSPGVDEAAVKADIADPAALAERLAVMKGGGRRGEDARFALPRQRSGRGRGGNRRR